MSPIEAMIFLGLAPILVFALLYALDWMIGWIGGENP